MIVLFILLVGIWTPFRVVDDGWGRALMQYFPTGSQDQKGWEPLHYTEEWITNLQSCSPEPKTCNPESIFPVRCLPVSCPEFWISNSHASALEQGLPELPLCY